MEYDLIEDLSKLTTINELSLNRVFDKVQWCICDYIEAAVTSGVNTVDINIGFGTLTINIDNDSIKYRFKPNKKLETAIIGTMLDDKNPLKFELENNLVQKITNIYKDMF